MNDIHARMQEQLIQVALDPELRSPDAPSCFCSIELGKDRVHDSGSQKNLPIWDGQRSAFHDGPVKRLDQILHAGLHVEVPCQKSPQVRDQVSEILLCDGHRRDEMLDVALEPRAAKLDERLLILIENKTVLRAIDTKLMERGTHLRRESEIGRRPLLFANDNSQFIDDFVLAHALEKRTRESIRDHLGRFAGQELRDPGNAVADDILQQFSWQPANPVSFVAKKRARIPGPSKLIAVITLHVHRPAAQKAALDQSSHASRHMPELIIMPRGYLEPPLVRERDQLSGLRPRKE